jgi:ubiquinone/menaquinone biosynthesis C-methylase UbiE
VTTERAQRVRAFFDRAENHRAAAHVTRLRAHVVRDLLGDVAGAEILDVGAGDGAVTIDLASTAKRLTWLDLSPEMLAAARARIPRQLADRIALVEGDLASFDGMFDVVVCVGVLAHVSDVDDAIRRLADLTRPGGRLVLELEDHAKLSTLARRISHRLRERTSPRYGYRLNATRLDHVDASVAAHGLRRIDQRRHWSTPPLLARVASPSAQAAFERFTLASPTMSKLGSSVVALYAKAT